MSEEVSYNEGGVGKEVFLVLISVVHGEKGRILFGNICISRRDEKDSKVVNK